MDDVRIGFIGVGGMGQHHLKTVYEIPGAQVVAVCDVNAELAEAMGAQYKARAYTDHHEMLEKESLDALYVVIPPFAHTDAELIAAERGIHLFVEKPVALTIEKARQIRDAVRQAGIITSVGYTLRYFEAATRLRNYLRDKTVAMVVDSRWGGVPGTPWWTKMSRSGGQLVEQTTHQVDLIRYMTGKEITTVYANYALRALSHWEEFDIPDVYSICMTLEDGTPYSLTSSCVMHKGGGKACLNFLLDGERIEVAGGKITTFPETNPDIDGPYGMELDIDAVFVEAVRVNDGSRIRSTYEDAVKTLAVTLAANESAQTGKPVPVPL